MGVRDKRVRDMTPDELKAHRAKRNAIARAYTAKKRKDPAWLADRARRQREHYWSRTPEQQERRRIRNNAWQAKQRAKLRPVQPEGFLACAAPSVGKDLLTRLHAHFPQLANRDDMIAEAALLVLEGASFEAAVKQARSNVNKQADLQFGCVFNEFANFGGSYDEEAGRAYADGY